MKIFGGIGRGERERGTEGWRQEMETVVKREQ